MMRSNTMEQHYTPLPQTTIESPKKSKNKVVIIFLFIILIVLAGIMVWSGERKKNSIQKQADIMVSPVLFPSITPTLIPYPTLGSMRLSTKDNEKRYKKNTQFTLILSARSQGKSIVGYDGVIGYEKQGFEFIKATSMLPEFKIYPFNRPTHLSVSGVKSLQNNSTTTWDDTVLIEVEFQAKQPGTYVFTLTPQGKETSKLVDDKAQVTYPTTGKLQLEIYE